MWWRLSVRGQSCGAGTHTLAVRGIHWLFRRGLPVAAMGRRVYAGWLLRMLDCKEHGSRRGRLRSVSAAASGGISAGVYWLAQGRAQRECRVYGNIGSLARGWGVVLERESQRALPGRQPVVCIRQIFPTTRPCAARQRRHRANHRRAPANRAAPSATVSEIPTYIARHGTANAASVMW
jgi:hypothetical protein